MEIVEEVLFSKLQFEIKNFILLLIDGLDQPNEKNIRSCTNKSLVHKYKTTMESIIEGFTKVKDCAAGT